MSRGPLHFAVVIITMCRALGPASNALADTWSRVTYEVGARPRSIAIADINGDGRLDVIVANSGDGTLSLLLGASGGKLELSTSAVPAGNEPADVDAVDLDNDHDIDLVVANHETSRITVLLNNGKARFVPAAGSPFESGARPHIHGVATGDFDGDGWNDVAVESSGTNEVLVLTGGQQGLSGALPIPVGTMPYYRLGAADVTGDGYLDVLIPGHGDNTARIAHRENGALSTSNQTLALSGRPWMVIGADVNGDERADMAVVLTDALGVWVAKSGEFSPVSGSPFEIGGATEVAAGDINGDGAADLVVGPWEGSDLTIIAGRSFHRQTVTACERPIGLAIADLDGDGRGEVLAACATGSRLMVLKWERNR